MHSLMANLSTHPLLLFTISFTAMWICARLGWTVLRTRFPLDEHLREDFAFILPASLTLLGLIVGFSFSMATGRYDQRKNYEEAEANAIGTEFVRVDFLPAPEAAKARTLLKRYLDERIHYYESQDDADVRAIDARVAQLQDQMWATIIPAATVNQSQVMALVVSGMNDVLNSQGYTQAAWSNRIPLSAWALMVAIAVCATMLVSAGARSAKAHSRLLPVLPLVVSIAFLLIADIDSPRRGMIRVVPQNLDSLSRSLHGR